jgi:membrane fusion protein, copper/silver efflux system
MVSESSYHCFNVEYFIIGIISILSISLIACKSDKKIHIDHQVATSKTVQQDSMPGMDMSLHNHELTDTSKMSNQVAGLSEDKSIQDETYWLSLPTNQTVVARQQAIKPNIGDTGFSIPANGYITFDARRNHKVPVRVGGRIERLYVKYNYQYVHKGEKILELYSPELNTYLEEYLYVKKSTNDSLLQRRAKEKIFLLGLSPLQVKQIEKTGRIPLNIAVYSPVEGYVLFNPSNSNASMESQSINSGGMSMSAGANTSPSTQATALSDNSIREGMYVSKDQTLFWINDFRVVWGVLAFSKQNEKYIKKGQVAVVQSELFPDQSFRSIIQFTEPSYQQGQKFTQARIYIPNSKGMLKQNSLITANIFLSGKTMMLPASSVMYLGRVAIVWVQTGTTKEGSNVFRSRVVKVGRKNGNQVEILSGLRPEEAVAKDASYLADSETIINY